MNKILSLLLLVLAAPQAQAALSAAAKYELNNKMGHVAHKHQLGSLLDALTPTSITTSTITASGVATFNNDVVGDGGDQLYGFLQSQVASTTTSATADQCGKTFVSDSADTITLPEASTVLGCRYTFVCGTADDFVINPADGTDAIGTVVSVTGTNTTTVLAPSAGDSITCTDIGSSIILEAVGANLWVSIGAANGIWTDTN